MPDKTVKQDVVMEPFDRRDRRWALAITAAAAVAVLVLSARIHHSGAPLRVDALGERLAFGHLFGLPVVPDSAARLVVSLGDTPVFATLVGIVVVIALVWRDWVSAVVAVTACPLALLATEIIGKPLVGRREGGGYGFPSGHTTAIATLVALVALVAFRRGRRKGLVAVAPVALLVPAMGLALVRVNFHLFSDTVAGALVGGGTVLGLAWLVSVLLARRTTHAHRPDSS